MLDIALVGANGYAAIDGAFVSEFLLTEAPVSGDIGPGTAFYETTYRENGSTRYESFTVWALNQDALSDVATSTPGSPVARQASTIDSPYISNRLFTSPTGAFTLEWSDDWDLQAIQEHGSRQTLTLANGPLEAIFTRYRSVDSARTCTEFRIAEIDAMNNDGISSTTSLETGSSDTNAAIIIYTSTATGQPRAAVAEIWCIALPNGEVAALTQTAPEDLFLALVPDQIDPTMAFTLLEPDGEGAADTEWRNSPRTRSRNADSPGGRNLCIIPA